MSLSAEAASVNAEDLISVVRSAGIPGNTTGAAASTVTVTVAQSWEVVFEVDGQQAAVLSARLEAACQLISPGCTLVNVSSTEGSRRRRAQVEDGLVGSAEVERTARALQSGTSTVTLLRPVVTGPLDAEIEDLEANSGVAVTDTTFQGAEAAMTVEQQGGTEEAEQLLSHCPSKVLPWRQYHGSAWWPHGTLKQPTERSYLRSGSPGRAVSHPRRCKP